MKQPSIQTRFFGHPLVAVPVALLCGWAVYQCYLGGTDDFIPGAFAVGVMVAVANANQKAKAYNSWKREWDEMAGTPMASGKLKYVLGFVAGVALLYAGFGAMQADPTAVGYAVVTGIALTLAATVAWVAGRWMRRRGSRDTQVVPVSVMAKPIMPVPTLDAAYASLPAYCQRLLEASDA